MSDDFDKKDWRDDTEPTDDGDDFDIDWLKDADDEGAPPQESGRTGVTGELSWLQASHGRAPDAPTGDDDDDLAFDWQGPQPAATADDDEEALPSWLAATPADDEPDDDEAPRFDLGADDDDDEPALSFANLGADDDDSAPSWLNDFGDDEEASVFSEARPAEEVVSPFKLSFDTPSEEPDAPEAVDLPPWLAGMDLMDEPPADDEETEPQPTAAQDLPAWLLGDDEEDSGATVAEAHPSAGEDISDWVLGETFDEEPSPPQAATASWMDDLEADLDAEAEAEDIAADLDDVFNLFDESPEALVGDETVYSDDFEAQPSADSFDLDALLDESPAAQADDLLLDDLLEDVGADLDALLATAAPATDEDLFADLDAPPLEPNLDDFDFGLDELLDEDEEAPTVAARDEQALRAALDDGDEEAVDWFGDDQDEAPTTTPNWLDDLGDMEALPAEEPFLDDLRAQMGEDEDAIEPAEDLDSFFASIDDFDTSQLVKPSKTTDTGDLDALFDTATRQEIERRPIVEVAPDAPEWLREVTVSDDDESASSIIRRQADKPLDELDERLLALRERGLSLAAAPTGILGASAVEGLTEIAGVLPPAELDTQPEEIARTVVLAPQQVKQALLLRDLVGGDVAAMATMSQEAADAAEFLAERPQRRLLARIAWERLIITLILAVAVLLPFFNILQIGSLPPAQFPPDSPAAAVFDGMEALTEGALVLVAVEYGPTAAGELDDATSVLLRHVLARGARPVIISTNPIALLRASYILDAVGGDRLVPNRDYYIIRYLPSNAIGLREFAANTGYLLRYDVQGRPTNLGNVSLGTFSAVVVIAERGEDLRAYAEQIVSAMRAPIYAVTGASAGPLAAPYLDEQRGLEGLLVGYRDAYTYAEMFNRLMGGAPLEAPTETLPITETPSPEPTTAATATPSESAPSATPTTSAPPIVPEDPTPTLEILPTETPTVPPTPTATVTASPTPSPTPVTVGIVTASGNVNIRQTPNGTPIGFARPGEELLVLGFNEDGTWLNIRKADGTEGWIVASLLRLEERPFAPEGESKRSITRGAFSHRQQRTIWAYRYQEDPTPTAEGFDEPTPSATSEAPTATPSPSTTPEPPTATPSPSATPEAPTTGDDTAGLAPLAVDREERWYAMTLGTLAAIVIIAFGAVINIARGIFRRGGE